MRTGLEKEEKREEEKSLRGGQARPYIRPRLLGTALALPHLLPKAGRPGGVCVQCVHTCVFVYLHAPACVYVCVNNRSGQMEQRWYRPVPCRGTHTYKLDTHSHTLAKLPHRFHNCLLWQTTQFRLTFKVHFYSWCFVWA